MTSASFRSLSPAHRAQLPKDSCTIRLTDLEKTLCTLLDDFTQVLRKENQIVECCIAGGWVRDKLLGLESNDIDIALSNMMGFPFALKFAEYLSARGVNVTRVTKVESRAEQSKHLETAKVAVLGLDLDFVNLRSEEYAEGSRIPTKVEFGTKLQDTLRRDITINALLYNIHTRSVEDHTQKGMDDLRHGIIRTPLPPKQTFLDDPLRVLRCVRFASRFGYSLVQELVDAAQDREIQAALDAKITRERVGEEIDKMMKGTDPLRAIQLIDSLALYRCIFAPPSSSPLSVVVPNVIQSHTALAAASILQHLLSQQSPPISHVRDEDISAPDSPIPPSLPSSQAAFQKQLHMLHATLLTHVTADQSVVRRLYLAAALTPFRNLTYVEKKKSKLVVEACIREALKLGVQNHYVDGIPALFIASELLSYPQLSKFQSPSPRAALGEYRSLWVKSSISNDIVGLLLRDKSVHNPNTGTHWTSSVLFSLVQELVPLWDAEKDTLDLDSANEILAMYTAFVCKVEELNLPQSLEDSPLLNGREVSSLLGAKKPGPWTGRLLNHIMEWQLAHPQGTKDDCAAWLKEEVNAGRLLLDGVSDQRDDLREEPCAKKARLSKVQ
ncbi:hypothetical protein K439DRAFT_1335219 [Ramaria rubella]|nr:hypothetical protein K439DRAFT_1335219 [Ramaria rubella]